MRYQPRPGVSCHPGNPPIFTTAEGGAVVTDDGLAALWSAAASATLSDLVAQLAANPAVADIVPEALACLSEAGLLDRTAAPRPTSDPVASDGPLVSVIIVVSSARELEYLDECLRSVAQTRYRSLQLVVVDNATSTALHAIVSRHVPTARVLALHSRRCLAAACNAAMARSEGHYALLMNPDVKLQTDTIARLVACAEARSNVAAVVPKTRLWRTPAFLNAIGNRVTETNWGTDNAIGQLDLGQFDEWRDPPSASLTIELLSRRAWAAVGPFNERFPAYYEDADWAYRARLMGWTIAAEPAAEAFHVFGGFWDAAPDGGLSTRKLETAVVGRLQFACRIADTPTLRRMLRNYTREDVHNLFVALRHGDVATARAYVSAWTSVFARAGALHAERRCIQALRVIDDDTLFPQESEMPSSYTYRNAPVLTAPLVRTWYGPLLRHGKTRTVPEMQR